MNGGKRSIPTFSFTTNRLLRCLRGGLPTMVMASLGPVRSRLRVLARAGIRGGPAGPSRPSDERSGEPKPDWRAGSASGCTTTSGGVEAGAGFAAYLLGCVPAAPVAERLDEVDVWEEGSDWLLELLLASPARPPLDAAAGCGSGFDVSGGGVDEVGLGSLVLDDVESLLPLSYIISCISIVCSDQDRNVAYAQTLLEGPHRASDIRH